MSPWSWSEGTFEIERTNLPGGTTLLLLNSVTCTHPEGSHSVQRELVRLAR